MNLPVLKYPEYTDLPSNAPVPTYSLTEISIEKSVAFLDRARTEPRDLYDLWFLTEKAGGMFVGSSIKKEVRLNKTWESRLSPQMTSLPEFEGVYRAVKRNLRQAKIAGY